MNRCLTSVLLTLTVAGAAHAQSQAPAQMRNFPKEALRGAMTVKQPPYLEMDDRVTRLSPGARVLDENNRLVRPASLLNREITVNYLLDRRGQVTQAWILTADEKKEKRAGYGVERNFSFESQQEAGTARTLPAPATPN